MSLAEVIYWVVQHLETNENMAFSCCLQHHLNESVLSSEMGVEQFVKLDSSHAKTHYLYVEGNLWFYVRNPGQLPTTLNQDIRIERGGRNKNFAPAISTKILLLLLSHHSPGDKTPNNWESQQKNRQATCWSQAVNSILPRISVLEDDQSRYNLIDTLHRLVHPASF